MAAKGDTPAELTGPAIETCQATAAATYMHVPAPVDGKAQPEETWSFECIEGAHKLAVSAAAAILASYMLA